VAWSATPHRRQVIRRQQLCENLGVDLVGLDLRLGDGPRLLRVSLDPRERVMTGEGAAPIAEGLYLAAVEAEPQVD
jgi:hypothetical protein